MTDPEKNWQEKWSKILQRPDGTIDVAQLKLELADFEDMIDRVTKLTCYMTRERLSYATYPVATLIAIHEEILEEEREEQMDEDLEDGTCSLCGREFDDEE